MCRAIGLVLSPKVGTTRPDMLNVSGRAWMLGMSMVLLGHGLTLVDIILTSKSHLATLSVTN